MLFVVVWSVKFSIAEWPLMFVQTILFPKLREVPPQADNPTPNPEATFVLAAVPVDYSLAYRDLPFNPIVFVCSQSLLLN